VTHTEALAEAQQLVASALKELDWPELPYDHYPLQGDLAVICFPAAKQLKRSPPELAKELATVLADRGLSASAEGGYCNITLDWRSLASGLLAQIASGDFGRGAPSGKRVLIEHTSANAPGPF
ncbi:uncharacterized protein METZ01_LOCUS115344, partial [marine metagenome]